MDNFNVHQAVMEKRKVLMYSTPGLELGKSDANFGYSAYTHSRIAQCSQPSAMWEGKVDMSEDPNMDCSENYSDMEVSIARAKINSENVRLKTSVIKVAAPILEMDLNMPEYIDKKLAAKKLEILPAETKDESNPPLEHLLGYLPKKRPYKRTMPNMVVEKATSYTLDIVKFKETDDLIQKIKTGTAQDDHVCITYNLERFSHIANLEPLPDEQVNSGSFGEVLKVRDTQTGEVLIQKKVKKNAKGEFEVEKNEIEVPLQFSDADNIAKFLGLAWNGIELTFIMEDAGISLRQVVSSPELMLSEPDKIERIMFDIFTGLYHLAKHGITHCDIKPENICLNVKTWTAKLVDFGSSRTRQNIMTYKGITPEYLDPLINKFLYEYLVLKNRSCYQPQLEEKDDVYSAGLVGLFLIKKFHPMIEFFTGSSDYPKDPAVTHKKRMHVMKQISELNDEMLLELLDIPMSNVMGELLPDVLALDREKRWTAKEAAFFLQRKLSPDLQPPKKLQRQETQTYQSLNKDLSVFVDLSEKSSDKVKAQTNEKRDIFHDGPRSPDIYHRDQEQGMGIALKVQPSYTQAGCILVPAKFKIPLQQGRIEPISNVQLPDTFSPQAGHQPYQRKLQHALPEVNLEEQENKDYGDLVKSFNVKMMPSMHQSFLTAHVAQRFVGLSQNQIDKNANQPSSPTNAQMLLPNMPQKQMEKYPSPGSAQCLLPNTETGPVHFHHEPVQEGQHGWKSTIRGLTGCVVKGSVGAGPPFETSGNLPDIDALMQTSDERTRPKIKGVRRSRASQD